MKGETLKTSDISYFVTAPLFETSSQTYSWLNNIQSIGKVVELKIGKDGYVKYDIFLIK